MSLYRMVEEPKLDDPLLLVALEGWIDAGGAAARAMESIIDAGDTTTVATFDTDALLDFRARRPIMHLVNGVNTGLTWASIHLVAVEAPSGQDVLLLTGAEPDHAWHGFCTAVHNIVSKLGCNRMYGFGAYPAAVPHTRPARLSATASTGELAESLGFIKGNIDVPGGIEAALEATFAGAGKKAVGLWAQVPHYVATMSYPAASVRLIEALNQVSGTDFDTDDLIDEVASTRQRIDALVEDNPQHVAMLRQLEEQYDAETEADLRELPSGDDLAEELQKFLREQDD